MSDISLRDPGLQPERTALAWHRTGWAIMLNAVLGLRMGVSKSSLGVMILALALIAASGAVFWFGAHRRRALLACQPQKSAPAATMLLLAAVVGVVASVGFVGIAHGALKLAVKVQ